MNIQTPNPYGTFRDLFRWEDQYATVPIHKRFRLLMDRLRYDSLEGVLADRMEFVDSRIEEFQGEYGPSAKAGVLGA
jgi:hypothetical protein